MLQKVGIDDVLYSGKVNLDWNKNEKRWGPKAVIVTSQIVPKEVRAWSTALAPVPVPSVPLWTRVCPPPLPAQALCLQGAPPVLQTFSDTFGLSELLCCGPRPWVLLSGCTAHLGALFYFFEVPLCTFWLSSKMLLPELVPKFRLAPSPRCHWSTVLGWPKSSFVFFCKMALVSFNFIQNSCVRLYCDSYHISVHFLKT